jgi:hypothetical protein
MASKIHVLVQKLIERTDQGKVAWEITPEKGAFMAPFPDYAVVLYRRRNYEDPERPDYIIAIHDDEGTVVDEITDLTLTGSGFENAFTRMEHLYEEARRKAMGVNRIIDVILGELG